MAESDLLVTISGAALSLLFFENVRSVSDQMGFLLGEALEFVIRTYTDSDNQVETVKTHINVETIVTCSLPDILHDSSSRINKEHLKDFIRDKSKQVIGWFHFRRSTNNLVPSMKDKLLHKQFAAHFSSGNGCKEEFFLTCLLSASTSEMRGTHKFRHVFLRRKREMFEPIPLRINNLGDDASRHDGSDYKPMPIRKSKCIPDGFTKLIESLNLDFTKTGGLDSAMEIQRVAERHLNSLIPKMCESDLEVADLERQVRELRVKIAAQQLIRKSKINGENCIKEIKENSLSSEVIETPWKNETNKIDDNASCLQNEHLSTSYIPQSVSSQRTACRNTAACIVKSVSQDRSRRLGLGSDVQEQQFHASADIVSGTNRHRRLGSISDITDEPINSEGNEVYTSSTRGKGRGRGNGNGNGNGSGSGSGSSSGSGSGSSSGTGSGTGSGSGVSVNRDRAHEFNIGVRKTRRVPSGAAHPSTRNVTPEQDFSDAAGTPHSPTISRSYNQASKKSLDGPRNTTGSLNI